METPANLLFYAIVSLLWSITACIILVVVVVEVVVVVIVELVVVAVKLWCNIHSGRKVQRGHRIMQLQISPQTK